MKRFGWLLVAVSSLLLSLTQAEIRPQYGGTLHLLLQSAPNSLDPISPQPDGLSSGNLFRLLYDNLVGIDDAGNPQPALAISWDAGPDRRHWHFQLRAGVRFDDGAPLTAEVVAASLRSANAWNVLPQGDSVEIDLEQADDLLLPELALPRNAIVKRGETTRGTGPFRVSEWVPGKRLVLNVNEEYWDGRPFVNSVEVEFGKSYREQEAALDLGRAEMVEIAPEQARVLKTAGRHVSESAPLELWALVFARDSQSPNESKLRDALALSVDRASIRDVLLGGEGELAGGTLPNWMTGYEFLFPAEMNVRRAQEERGEVNQAALWSLGYDGADTVAQVLAERIALNARDVGLRVQPVPSTESDVRLVRIRLQSADPGVALKNMAVQLGLPEPKLESSTTEKLYQAESALLQGRRIIPLFHLPVNYGLSPEVKGWRVYRDGRWPLTDVWLKSPQNSTD